MKPKFKMFVPNTPRTWFLRIGDTLQEVEHLLCMDLLRRQDAPTLEQIKTRMLEAGARAAVAQGEYTSLRWAAYHLGGLAASLMHASWYLADAAQEMHDAADRDGHPAYTPKHRAEMINYGTLAERLAAERSRLGLTQAEMAERGGCNVKAQCHYESGAKVPDANYLLAIAEAGADVNFIVIGVRTQVQA